jgi:TetR/AcrR family transcriptional regulator, transcriptional repressor for nem operon
MARTPLKRQRNPKITRARILEVAFMEIYCEGFRGASIDVIAHKAGVTKGAFFHHFATKFEVGYAIIDELLRAGILERWIAPLARYDNPIDGMIAQFKLTFETWPQEYVARGCPLNNLTQEMSGVDPIFKDKSRAVLTLWLTETERYLRQARARGFLRRGVRIRDLARFVVTFQEGTFAMGKALDDRSVFDSSYQSFRSYLRSLMPISTGRPAH